MPGIDTRYKDALRLLERRSFKRVGSHFDMEGDFRDIAAAWGDRPMDACTVTEHTPEDADDMRAFDKTGYPRWCNVYRDRVCGAPGSTFSEWSALGLRMHLTPSRFGVVTLGK